MSLQHTPRVTLHPRVGLCVEYLPSPPGSVSGTPALGLPLAPHRDLTTWRRACCRVGTQNTELWNQLRGPRQDACARPSPLSALGRAVHCALQLILTQEEARTSRAERYGRFFNGVELPQKGNVCALGLSASSWVYPPPPAPPSFHK